MDGQSREEMIRHLAVVDGVLKTLGDEIAGALDQAARPHATVEKIAHRLPAWRRAIGKARGRITKMCRLLQDVTPGGDDG